MVKVFQLQNTDTLPNYFFGCAPPLVSISAHTCLCLWETLSLSVTIILVILGVDCQNISTLEEKEFSSAEGKITSRVSWLPWKTRQF